MQLLSRWKNSAFNHLMWVHRLDHLAAVHVGSLRKCGNHSFNMVGILDNASWRLPMSNRDLAFQFDQDFSQVENGASKPDSTTIAPELSAYNQTSESWRLDRLRSVWGQACAAVSLLSNRYQRHWRGAIVAMEDCKGTLQLTWRDEQSRTMFEGAIMGAWEREGDHAGAHALLEMDTLNA